MKQKKEKKETKESKKKEVPKVSVDKKGKGVAQNKAKTQKEQQEEYAVMAAAHQENLSLGIS